MKTERLDSSRLDNPGKHIPLSSMSLPGVDWRSKLDSLKRFSQGHLPESEGLQVLKSLKEDLVSPCRLEDVPLLTQDSHPLLPLLPLKLEHPQCLKALDSRQLPAFQRRLCAVLDYVSKTKPSEQAASATTSPLFLRFLNLLEVLLDHADGKFNETIHFVRRSCHRLSDPRNFSLFQMTSSTSSPSG